MTNIQAGWHPDPAGRHEYRYWDGQQWSDQVSNGGVTASDPLPAAPQPEVTAPEPVAAAAPVVPAAAPPTPDPTVVSPLGAPDAPTQVAPAPAGWGPAPQAGPGGPGMPPGAPAPEKSGPPKGLLIGGAVAIVAVIAIAVFALTRGDDAPAAPAASVGEIPTVTEPELPDTVPQNPSEVLDDIESFLEDVGADSSGGSPTEDFDLDSAMEGFDEVEMLTEIYQGMLGLDAAQAECLANEMMSVLEANPGMDEADLMMDAFGAFDACGISMDQFGE